MVIIQIVVVVVVVVQACIVLYAVGRLNSASLFAAKKSEY